MGQKRIASGFIFLSIIFLSLPRPLHAQQASHGRNSPITALAPTPDGREILAGSQAGVFFTASANEPTKAFATELDHVHHLAFSRDGSLLAVAGGSPGEFGSVELWSWPERKLVGQLDGHEDVVYDAVWLGDGKTIVTGSADRTVRVWEAATGKQLAKLAGHSGPVLCLASLPDGKLLCSGSADATIRVWDTGDWRLIRAMTNHLGPVHGLAFRSTTDRAEGAERQPALLASAGGDGTVRIWQPEIGRLVRIVRHPAPVHCLAWDDRGVLWSGAKDGRLRAIDSENGNVTNERPVGSGWLLSLVASSPAHRLIAGSASGEVMVIGPDK